MTGSAAPCVLTLDIGTSSVRAMLFDAHARPLPNSVAQRQVRPEATRDGGAYFDAEALLQAVIDVIDQVLHSTGPDARAVGAVTMGTLVGNVLGVDAAGQAVSPVYIYADTRNAADAQALRQELGAAGRQAAHDRTGCLIHTSYLPARFRWLRRTHPEQFERARRWVSVGEYILHHFLGVWRVSYSVASWSGMLNRHELAWDAEWLDALDLDADLLSPVGDLSEPLQGLRDEFAARWPGLQHALWVPAVGDGAAANVGSGCVAPDRVALTVGTTGAMRVVVTPDPDTVPDGLWLYRVDAARGLLGGATTEGGNVFAWLQDSLLLPNEAALEAQLLELSPAAHGLTVLPFWGGERAPGWREDALGHVGGLRLSTKPIEIVQACLEAMSYRFALIYQGMKPYLQTDAGHAIIASGGALLSSPAWLQMTADVLGRSIITSAEREATSRGLAVLGLEQLGLVGSAKELPAATGKCYEPIAKHHEIHQVALERQIALYRALLG